jgi:hypothetical protein
VRLAGGVVSLLIAGGSAGSPVAGAGNSVAGAASTAGSAVVKAASQGCGNGKIAASGDA